MIKDFNPIYKDYYGISNSESTKEKKHKLHTEYILDI